MPHPENLIDPLVGGTDGRGMFESLQRFTFRPESI
jgi:phosphoribosylformylglycinamidine synthase